MGQVELDYELITPSARIATATHGGRQLQFHFLASTQLLQGILETFQKS